MLLNGVLKSEYTLMFLDVCICFYGSVLLCCVGVYTYLSVFVYVLGCKVFLNVPVCMDAYKLACVLIRAFV